MLAMIASAENLKTDNEKLAALLGGSKFTIFCSQMASQCHINALQDLHPMQSASAYRRSKLKLKLSSLGKRPISKSLLVAEAEVVTVLRRIAQRPRGRPRLPARKMKRRARPRGKLRRLRVLHPAKGGGAVARKGARRTTTMRMLSRQK